ncbi:hypothetical protein KPL40_19645 [Clostridium gasigenes]|uniref:hypothetical protein n=1 Tax=Clostridium gasigenes TaxID=94869 RepID=UPI001C0DD6B5|nr:hypothetical protein [Clostridium gasigenes]MBU3134619.1 hypothetical protein [Clostridium gasigenes]
MIKIYWVFAYNQNDIDRRMIKWLDFVPFKFKFFAKRFAKKHDFYECYYKEKGQKYGKEVVL